MPVPVHASEYAASSSICELPEIGTQERKDTITLRILERTTHLLPLADRLQFPRAYRTNQAVKGSSRVYLEAYTSILMVQKERLVCALP